MERGLKSALLRANTFFQAFFQVPELATSLRERE